MSNKPREWTLTVRGGATNPEESWYWEINGPKPYAYHDDITVREVREGEVVLTRERLREAWEKASVFVEYDNGGFVTTLSDIERELFGPAGKDET